MKKQKLTAFLLAVSVAVSGGGVVAAQGGMVPADTVQDTTVIFGPRFSPATAFPVLKRKEF